MVRRRTLIKLRIRQVGEETEKMDRIRKTDVIRPRQALKYMLAQTP